MSYVINTLKKLPFKHLIGSPMTAAIEAQADAAKTTVDFITKVGFQQKDQEEDPFFTASGENVQNADVGDVRNVTFKYAVADETADGSTSHTATLTVPILTIIPIPYIRIDEMTIDFMAKISEITTNSSKNMSASNRNIAVSASYGWRPFRIGFNASFSSRHSSTTESASRYQTESTMNVHVRAVQDELPAGLSKVLNILEDIIKEERPDNSAQTPKPAK